MYLFWIALAVLVLSVILEIIAANENWWPYDDILGPILITLSIVFATASAVEVFDKQNVEKFEYQYSITLKKINEYSAETDFELLDELYSDCKDIDSTINTNLRLYNSKWRGHAYSKEIGLTPPITNIFTKKLSKAEL